MGMVAALAPIAVHVKTGTVGTAVTCSVVLLSWNALVMAAVSHLISVCADQDIPETAVQNSAALTWTVAMGMAHVQHLMCVAVILATLAVPVTCIPALMCWTV